MKIIIRFFRFIRDEKDLKYSSMKDIINMDKIFINFILKFIKFLFWRVFDDSILSKYNQNLFRLRII